MYVTFVTTSTTKLASTKRSMSSCMFSQPKSPTNHVVVDSWGMGFLSSRPGTHRQRVRCGRPGRGWLRHCRQPAARRPLHTTGNTLHRHVAAATGVVGCGSWRARYRMTRSHDNCIQTNPWQRRVLRNVPHQTTARHTHDKPTTTGDRQHA